MKMSICVTLDLKFHFGSSPLFTFKFPNLYFILSLFCHALIVTLLNYSIISFNSSKKAGNTSYSPLHVSPSSVEYPSTSNHILSFFNKRSCHLYHASPPLPSPVSRLLSSQSFTGARDIYNNFIINRETERPLACPPRKSNSRQHKQTNTNNKPMLMNDTEQNKAMQSKTKQNKSNRAPPAQSLLKNHLILCNLASQKPETFLPSRYPSQIT